MVDGQQNNEKIGFIIQARMKSDRLPGKVMMPIPLGSGKPLLKWITDELGTLHAYGEVIIVTSADKSNDPLADYCEEHHIKCYRGSEEDVLSRFIAVIKAGHLDTVVRLTGDNPLIDAELLMKVVRDHLAIDADYTITKGLPLGMNFEVVKASALINLEDKLLTPGEHEHVTLHIRNSDSCKVNTFSFDTKAEIARLRLTVDYPTDYIVLSTLLSLKNQPGSPHSMLAFVEEVYGKYPWLFDLNRENIQKTQENPLQMEMEEAYKLLQNFGFKRAAEKLKHAI